ncbi:hypothetical protein, partial [Bacillus inaquosorum]
KTGVSPVQEGSFLCEKVFAGNVMTQFGHSYNIANGFLRWEHEQLFD